MPSYLGTQANLTGIPSLLISNLSAISDPGIQQALYQTQNWANSFFPWNYDLVEGVYATGGVQIDFLNPYPSGVEGLTVTPFFPASQVAIVSQTVAGFFVKLYVPNGTEFTNGASYELSYISVGH